MCKNYHRPPNTKWTKIDTFCGLSFDLYDSNTENTVVILLFLFQTIVRYMGIKRTNASTLLTIGLPQANALYPIYNLMNSGCTCNTRCTIDEKSYVMTVRAQTRIRKGEEITTRYSPPWEGQPTRLAKIWKHWQFVCHCERCKDPTEFGTFFSAIKYVFCTYFIFWSGQTSIKMY